MQKRMQHDHAIMNCQKGILHPLITPAQIVKHIKASQADITSELSLPISTGCNQPKFNCKYN